MSSIVELIRSFDHNSKDYELILHDLIRIDNDIPFDPQEIDAVQDIIITTVNTLLNQASTRYGGLLILDKILQRCSKDVLLKYGMLWISKATQVLENVHSSHQDVSLTCKVLGGLVSRSKGINELQKQVSLQSVKCLINVIVNLGNDRRCGATYYLIAVLLRYYPEICERFQASIQKIVLLQADSKDENLVLASAKCYALLAKATERSFKPPSTKATYTGWLYSQLLICNSLHSIMDELFSNLIELEGVDIGQKLDMPEISDENIIEYYSAQKQRFLNLCHYLSTMLRGCDEKNSVSPRDILQILCRGLAITPVFLKNRDSFREQMLYLILPKLHISLLNVLDAFIVGFKEQLVPFGSAILQLFSQTLRWTEVALEGQTTIGGSKPFKNVRKSAYKCLSSWLQSTNSLSGVETIADEHLPFILKDTIPERDRILLTVQKTKHLSKRAMKRLRDSQYEKNLSANNVSDSTKKPQLDADLCKEALIALQGIFCSAGAWLKLSFFKNVQNSVVPLLYDLYINSEEQKFYKENSDCRLQLLKVLKALQMNPHSQSMPPTQYSIEVFEMALNDSDARINHEAQLTLAALEKVIHPIAPTLQLSRVEEEENEEPTNDSEEDHAIDIIQETTRSHENTDTSVTPPASKRMKISNVNAEQKRDLIQEKKAMDLVENEKNRQLLDDENNSLMKDIGLSQELNIEHSNNTENNTKPSLKRKSVSNVTEGQAAIKEKDGTEKNKNDDTKTTETTNDALPTVINDKTADIVEHETHDTREEKDKNVECVTATQENVSKTSEETQAKVSTADDINEEEMLLLFRDELKENY